jgi:alpha-galactosidase
MLRPISLVTLLACSAALADISGTWVAKRTSPMGETEIVYRLQVSPEGKITGTQSMPFGDSPIVDGKITGDTFELVVETESFGDIQKRTVTGKIVGDTLEITPAMPMRPAGAPAPPPNRPRMGPVIARRGIPTPSFRAPSVDYKNLPRFPLPQLKDIGSNELAKTPPMGWNSWNKFRSNISDATVRGVASAVVSSGMKAAGYQYILIDDGWQGKERDANGVLMPNPNFPDMKALSNYVHLKGLKLGIYSSPGPTTCGGFQGSYAHEELDARTWAAWGIDYLKYDWCSGSRVWKDEDMRAVYQIMGDALNKSGRQMVYALCQYGRANVGDWGPRLGANLWRTTSDIQDRWESMTTIGFSQSNWAKFAAPGHWNDPDMLEIGNGGMSQDEYKTHFTLWSMVAAPLIAGNDVRDMTPAIREVLLNREVIAIDQDMLGKGGYQAAKDGDSEIWVKPMSSGGHAIALFNRSDAKKDITANWSALGIAGDPRLRDLWAHEDRQSTGGSFTATVEPHGVVLLRTLH